MHFNMHESCSLWLILTTFYWNVGWCAVKPEMFQESYGSICQALEGGDICLSLNAARSPNNNVISINNNHNNNNSYIQQQQLLHHSPGFVNSLIHGSPNHIVTTGASSNLINNNSIINAGGAALSNMHNISHLHLHSGNNTNINNNNNSLVNQPINSLLTSSTSSIKMETIDEKPIPISVLPQNQHGIHPMHIMQSPPPPPLQHPQSHHQHHPQRNLGGGAAHSRKTCAAVPMSAPGSPAKRPKDANKDGSTGDQPAKGRRPMNAFLLFAKDKRPELIQKYPGKDNR